MRVVVSGVNPTDWNARTGGYGPLPFLENDPNQDGAGVVDTVGSSVTGLALSDRVWVHLAAHERPSGTAQEFTVLPGPPGRAAARRRPLRGRRQHGRP